MKRLDIIYILKEDIDPAELTYSLRSVEQNFPHRKVWFVAGQPDGLYPDGRLAHHQVGLTKWARVRSSLLKIVVNDDITDDFYLFNDDFFVMKSWKGEFINFTNGTLLERIQSIERKRGHSSNYSRSLMRINVALQLKHYDTISFAVHMPMLLNKEMLKNFLIEFPDEPMFRSVYGNMNRIPYTFHQDVKIVDLHKEPDPECDFLSTSEDSFRYGKVGQFIRDRFPNPSRFEKEQVIDVHEHYTEEGDLI